MRPRKKTDANRCVQLTDDGLSRFTVLRRRLGMTIDEIASDRDTPSANTVKRTLRKEPVFVGTLERIWGYLQRRATESRQTLPPLIEGEDYAFVEATDKEEADEEDRESPASPSDTMAGWISRHVPRPNRLFTGRREELQRLHAGLRTGAGGLSADPQAITGLGGVGKTQTAIAYIYTYRNEYSRIFWVNAETVLSLNDGLANLAEELPLSDATPVSRSQALAKVHDWFRDASNWLLVLDNADDIATLAPYFPRHHSGSLLLTTRTRNTVKWAAPLSLDKLDRTEGMLLLLRRAGRLGIHQTLETVSPEIATSAGELIDELEGLPLAISQAGAYLAETMGSVAEYLAKYRARGLELLDSTDEQDHASVTVTYYLALEQLAKRSSYGAQAVEIVRLCAFLAPDEIPEVIFSTHRFVGSSSAYGNEDYDAICGAVCGYSLATRNSEERALSVHRLVQQATQATLSSEEKRLWAEYAINAVSRATPDFEPEDWPLCERLLPHWRVCAGYIDTLTIETPEAAYLLYQMGRYLRARALYEDAVPVAQKALAVAEVVYGPVHETTADYLDEIACLYRERDRIDEAKALHARALRITEEVLGAEHMVVATRLHNMAVLYFGRKEYSVAEELFLRSLSIREKYTDQENQLLMAAALMQLTGVYRERSMLDQAEACCKRGLDISERILGPDHVSVATGCNNLAILYTRMERYAEADALLLRALKINEEARGKEHPEIGSVCWNMAKSLREQHRYEEADRIYQRAIRIYQKGLGKEHSWTNRLLSDYADFKRDKQMQEEVSAV